MLIYKVRKPVWKLRKNVEKKLFLFFETTDFDNYSILANIIHDESDILEDYIAAVKMIDLGRE